MSRQLKRLGRRGGLGRDDDVAGQHGASQHSVSRLFVTSGAEFQRQEETGRRARHVPLRDL